MLRTKFKYENKQRAIVYKKKKKQARVKVHVHCTPLDKFYPPTKFHKHRTPPASPPDRPTARPHSTGDPIIRPVFGMASYLGPYITTNVLFSGIFLFLKISSI